MERLYARTDDSFRIQVCALTPIHSFWDYVTLCKVAAGHGENSNYLMDGYQMLVRGEVFRGKYRNSFEKPEPFVPNLPTTIQYDLPDVAHTFKKGHRIMVQIQSSWFPLADRNPQQFVNIYEAKPTDFLKSDIKVFGNSSVELPVWRK